MKFLVALSALAAAASAQHLEHLTHPYAYGLHAFGGKSAPCVNALNLPVPCAGAPFAYAGLPYAHGIHGKKKREADADAQHFGHHGFHGHHGHALGYKSAPCVNAANHPVPCAVGAYHGHHLGHHYGKREAEAQVYLAGHHGFAGHHGLVGAVAHPLAYGHHGIPNPVHAVAHTPAGLVHSSLVGLCTNYLGAAVPCRRKRDAVEAEAAVVPAGHLIGAYGLHGLGYAGLGHLGYAGLGHQGLVAAPLAHHVVAPVATVHNAVLGTAELPNPVHAVAHTVYGTVHSSHIGVCTNYLGEQVTC